MMSGFGSIGGGGGTYDLSEKSAAEATGKSGNIYTGAKTISFAPNVDNTLYYVLGAGIALYVYLKYVRGK